MAPFVGARAPGLTGTSDGDGPGQEEDHRGRPAHAGSEVGRGFLLWSGVSSPLPAASHPQLKLVSSNVPPGDRTHLLFQQSSRQAGLICQMGCHFP